MGKPSFFHQGSEAGFTLVELMVVVLVAGILAAGILGLFTNVLHVFTSENNRMLSQDGARSATQQMSRYLRGASSSVLASNSVSDAIAGASPQEVVFYVDLDGNGTTSKVRYFLDGTLLKMQTSRPVLTQTPPVYPAYQTTGIISQGVTNGSTPLFTYYRYDDSSPKGLKPYTDLASISAIKIDITVNESPKLSMSGSRLVTVVQIRQRYTGGL